MKHDKGQPFFMLLSKIHCKVDAVSQARLQPPHLEVRIAGSSASYSPRSHHLCPSILSSPICTI